MLRRHFIENSDSNDGIIKISYVADSQQFFCTEENEFKEGDVLYNALNIPNNTYWINTDFNEYIFLKEDYDINSKIGNWYFKCITSLNTIATGFCSKSDSNIFSTFLCKDSKAILNEFTQLEISEGVEKIKAGFGIAGLFGVTNNNLNTIILPQSLKYIDDGAFLGFTNITNIIGGNNLKLVTNIKYEDGRQTVFGGYKDTFYNDYEEHSIGKVLFRVKIEPNVKVPEGFNQYYTTLFLGGEEIIESIEPVNNFTKIYPSMFKNFVKLNTIDLSNVTNIEKEAFRGCTNLKRVDLSNVSYIGKNAFTNSGIEEFTFDGDKLVDIEEYGFAKCTNLKIAVIPINWEKPSTSTSNITIYQNCSNIEIVYFNAKQASSGGANSYGYLYKSRNTIKTVIIGKHVTNITKKAFYKCALENITYKGTIEQWNLIVKNTAWYGDAVTTVIHCTDGDIELERI